MLLSLLTEHLKQFGKNGDGCKTQHLLLFQHVGRSTSCPYGYRNKGLKVLSHRSCVKVHTRYGIYMRYKLLSLRLTCRAIYAEPIFQVLAYRCKPLRVPLH